MPRARRTPIDGSILATALELVDQRIAELQRQRAAILAEQEAATAAVTRRESKRRTTTTTPTAAPTVNTPAA